MKETYIDEKDLNMYRIVPAPPKWDLQEEVGFAGIYCDLSERER